MIDISKNGNDHISPFQHRIWNFTYTVLQKFGCPIQFKVDGPNVPHKISEMITFFVPEGRGDVAEYIVQEWKDDVRQESSINGEWFWGTSVHVMFFSGSELYTEREVIQDMAQNMMLYLTAKIQKKNANVIDFSTAPKTKH